MRVSKPGAVEECGACAELLVPRSVTSVLSAGCTLSVLAAALQVTRISPEVLLVFGVVLVLGVGLVCSTSVLSGEGTGREVVQLLPGLQVTRRLTARTIRCPCQCPGCAGSSWPILLPSGAVFLTPGASPCD